ncbi:hypothetical protein K4754_06475 [Pseudomonas glycinae]|uniref:hypothetical protein n=1 Tax=Pseudomonas glycinae TaxID=1785145 RepID=UPI001C8AD881|nr:hypothetical protein [Pseudomonas glycinae]MBX8621669.1 hypothetical protein [Pseudomonas glycinae]
MLVLDRPRDWDTHSIADFGELLCLLTPDRICSRETISDQIRDVGDSNISDVQLDDCFNNIEWRASAFGDSYPFKLQPGSKTFSAPEDLNEPQTLYALTLLCANLPFVQDRRGQLTDAFERLAFIALSKTMPIEATIRPFGKNETNYTGAKWERLNQLASHIGGYGRCQPSTFRARDSGDGGIDIASWLILDNYENRNIPSALAQCACSRSDWPAKQTEISYTRLGTYIQPTHPWMQVLFIPHCFRDNIGNWAYEGDVGMTIVYDRLRLVNLINSGEIDWAYISSPEIFIEFLEARLELV